MRFAIACGLRLCELSWGTAIRLVSQTQVSPVSLVLGGLHNQIWTI